MMFGVNPVKNVKPDCSDICQIIVISVYSTLGDKN